MTQATTESATGDEGDLTTAQAAEMLGITRRYLYELIAAGEIATIRLPLGPEHRIERSEIKAFRDRNRQRAGVPATT